jgi:hypothetical protein
MITLQYEGSSLGAIMFLKNNLAPNKYATFFAAYKQQDEDLFTYTQEGEGKTILNDCGVNFIWWA